MLLSDLSSRAWNRRATDKRGAVHIVNAGGKAQCGTRRPNVARAVSLESIARAMHPHESLLAAAERLGVTCKRCRRRVP